MKKDVSGRNVFYSLKWSKLHKYDKYSATRIAPDLPGILAIAYIEDGNLEYLLFFGCWRNGFRTELKRMFDPDQTKFPALIDSYRHDRLFFKYCNVDTKPEDIQDILYYLFKTYEPRFNNFRDFHDSQRYQNISVKELVLDGDSVVEKTYRPY